VHLLADMECPHCQNPELREQEIIQLGTVQHDRSHRSTQWHKSIV
jgi:pyruvate-formate lyase-activating enzyme